jgi:hypothetical protein
MTSNDWKQTGNVYLWRYKDDSKKFLGWHMTADEEGAMSFVSLVDIFLQSDTDARRTVRLTIPIEREVSVPNFNRKADPAEKLVLEIVAKENSLWSLSGKGKKITLRVGRSHLLTLRDGIDGIEKGKGDYCIGEKGQELWFWWRIPA